MKGGFPVPYGSSRTPAIKKQNSFAVNFIAPLIHRIEFKLFYRYEQLRGFIFKKLKNTE